MHWSPRWGWNGGMIAKSCGKPGAFELISLRRNFWHYQMIIKREGVQGIKDVLNFLNEIKGVPFILQHISEEINIRIMIKNRKSIFYELMIRFPWKFYFEYFDMRNRGIRFFCPFFFLNSATECQKESYFKELAFLQLNLSRNISILYALGKLIFH